MAGKSFNEAEFKAGFRAACQQHGVNPEIGATAFQVALIKAEQAKAKTRQSNRGWWKRSAMWSHCPPYVSSTEQVAVFNVFTEAFASEIERVARRLVHYQNRAG